MKMRGIGREQEKRPKFEKKRMGKKSKKQGMASHTFATTIITLIIIKITNVYKPNSINNIQLMCLK